MERGCTEGQGRAGKEGVDLEMSKQGVAERSGPMTNQSTPESSHDLGARWPAQVCGVEDFWASGAGFTVQELGFGVQSLGSRVQGPELFQTSSVLPAWSTQSKIKLSESLRIGFESLVATHAWADAA